ncbi:neuroplastin-like [Biomphalaria glabrata]|uniref:Neuroplastin-like n=1 Tax=Biomphalaria glabrata TaxID=6526 RepID=A0A9W2ZDR9_BIOGL|nr:neuroplastin-like [Biomphalaria glabrata]KAI8752412.1 neuroplastin-like [Biomphalaria glabrata]KAI8786189.1 neuroplastin [Biomphalaria glabrata]
MSGFTLILTFWLSAVIALSFAADPADVIFTFNDKNATLTCNATDNNSYYVGWYHLGQSVTGTRYTVTNLTHVTVLVITSPTREDSGEYVATFLKTGGTQENCTIKYTATPLVLDLAKSKNLEKDQDLDLHCDVKGYPGSVVSWSRDGIDLTNTTSRVTLKNDGIVENAYLHIKSLEYSDEGTYKCTAYSKHFNFSHSKSLVIRVKNPIAWVWPLVGILVEIIVLAVIIFACSKFDKRRLIQTEQNDLYRNEGHGTRNHGAEKTD